MVQNPEVNISLIYRFRQLWIACCVWGGMFWGNTLFAQPLQRYEFSQPHMGTEFSLIFYTTGDSIANQAAEKAFSRIADLNQSMSDYIPDSELNQLASSAGKGTYVPVSQDLWKVLARSGDFYRHSHKAFDITIGPLSRLWRRAIRKGELPEKNKIEENRKLVGFNQIRFRRKDHSVKLRRSGMRLDLGGIAKGYAIDEAFYVLRNEGIQIALVDGGGDIRLGNPPPGTRGWRIEIAQPATSDSLLLQQVWLSDCAVATSGDTYRFIEANGKRYSHIIDPRTGYGISDRRMVTIIATNATDADAMASTASLVDFEQSRKAAHRLLKRQNYYLQITEISDRETITRSYPSDFLGKYIINTN